MRALAALQAMDGTSQQRLIAALDLLWEEFFVKHSATQEPAELRRILANALGDAEADKVIEAASGEGEGEGKKVLTRNTDDAFKDGAFGVPWMVCSSTDGRTEAFWGVDHLGRLASFLGLEKPATSGWKSLL